ncbi:XrtN system VIT domain-containing protein [Pedobacter frigoris]|uniref:XrtN system VIT domain-containing protein n=1 Tax=Pedobacter frigoris TaxID=2571272 RepID=A0A4U1CIS5_9SPHI|nr:XrtN system VIT domain-containing protein [Pedobacter frigoris]TKC07313.1 XrtN system VIT domain-containing protein [Pedobacter frigoris]
MKRLKNFLIADKFRFGGLLTILTSITVLMSFDYVNIERNAMPCFFFCYGITVIYTITVFGRAFYIHRWQLSKAKITYTTLMLILWFISAFALNKEMNVFDSSAIWLSVYICLSSTAVIASTLQDWLPSYIKPLLAFLLAAALVLFIYYAAYLFPLYAMSILAAIFIGLSLHTFIPLLLAIVTIIALLRLIKSTPKLKFAVLAGIVIPLMICAWFNYQWRQVNETTGLIANLSTLKEDKLPVWVSVAQQLPKNFVTEKYLKADLVYTTPRENNNWFWGDPGGNSFDEPKKHDPLVMIASLLFGKTMLDDKDKISIIKSMYNSRHLAQNRLWSGDNLETINVVSNIMIYPEYRMAYTEKKLTIQNTNTRRWRNSEEAIYTFQLPEGAVVSSLSLWINGIEEKAHLTTKNKADSAYKTIVGVENRDPSVIHWQEGNTVSVRVFPCTTEENRKFKIGITSPLKKENETLTYQNADFSGPTFKNALEIVQVNFSSRPKELETDLKPQKDGSYLLSRNYKDNWDLTFTSVPLSANTFSFGGSSYKLSSTSMMNTSFRPTAIYLDINSSWSQEEINTLWKEIKTSNVYAYTDKMLRLNNKNLKDTYEQLQKLNFSMFPFYEIKDPGNALVITKGTKTSPNLNDLSGSEFAKSTSAYFAKSTPFRLFMLSGDISPYLKTLKEFRTFRYQAGGLNTLTKQLKQHSFSESKENANTLMIGETEMLIEKTADSSDNQAPDHLLRLFAYNDILKRVGQTYFEKDYVSEDLLKIADQAFIVSPVSSLIVLETQKDYERFNIERSKNSLQNASMKSSGAAPEPHEWLLILIASGVILYFGYKSSYFSKVRSA